MAKDIRGSRFGMLTVRAQAADGRWICNCDCGGEVTADRRSLVSGRVKRCSCLADAVAAMARAGHKGLGSVSLWRMQPERQSWCNMIDRCTNKSHRNWKHYGGRGIQVCAKWRQDFDVFLSDVGPMPRKGYTLERIDVDGDYEPGNVRWATREEQSRNKRTTVWVRITAGDAAGQVLPLAVAAERLGLTPYKARAQMVREDGLVRTGRPRQAA